ncbi:hypothetical protein TREMEDRAFT_34294 [Tremella mesenterica DSM 1558]|uniref:uncharacterized protein n=1 Tax=Tremella mesenterica (strain ATCC 24925 / CBS 8224 / DSM 1558 / NBRC 9311 / NRRL Y-6157 / RJB 2259-6 / UBC 559-6) TaxID=578456 RepID=UPI0003F4A5D2|nr:uncharacterized protein TREMEDRAFT_34294 [Tremella mesenterica DSM 1558]EIW67035.1 hypothetical protein TREMEDRAFT_34294 [Tremella mesenterica DSM 1558]
MLDTDTEKQKLKVMISMELEGVTEVVPAEEEFQYFFTVMCSNCRETHPNTISFNVKDEVEITGSRGHANFVWRCHNCKKENTASIIPTPPSKSISPTPYTTSGQWDTLISLDCRGLEFTKFHFVGKWKWKGKKQEFEVEFEDGRWDDYDEINGLPVGINDIKSEIRRA